MHPIDKERLNDYAAVTMEKIICLFEDEYEEMEACKLYPNLREEEVNIALRTRNKLAEMTESYIGYKNHLGYVSQLRKGK